jgi:hypothetical protein
LPKLRILSTEGCVFLKLPEYPKLSSYICGLLPKYVYTDLCSVNYEHSDPDEIKIEYLKNYTYNQGARNIIVRLACKKDFYLGIDLLKKLRTMVY